MKAKPCVDGCDSGTIKHAEGQMPCPYCRPDEARDASSVYDPEPVCHEDTGEAA